ncbi:MAG: peptidylprolyl isomerase [Bacilli bacterium]
MKKIILLILSLFLITGCGNVELKNGEQAAVTFKNKDAISSNELYNVLKEKYGTDELVNMIDTFLLEKEYDSTDEEKKYLNDVIESVKSAATKNNITFEEYISQYYGQKNARDFNNYVKLNFKRSQWIKDYGKTLITDSQINTYYENVAIGDISASHILIKPEVKEGATTEEQKAAEEKALATAKDIIVKLNNKENFADLAKKYSADTVSAVKGGVLDPFNLGQMDKNFEAAAIDLKVGTYSKTPVKSQFGYHIIFKSSQAKKPALKDIKDNIVNTLAEELLENDKTIYLKAIEALRKKYDMNIKDSTLNTGYKNLMEELSKQNKKASN